MNDYTHPDVFTRGVREGWADPETDPTQIDWTARLALAAISFRVVNGRPISPAAPTGIRHGRGELGHWGECQAADAIVTAHLGGVRHLLLIERGDGHGWAIPGGKLDPGETALAAAIRELEEETGLSILSAPRRILTTRYVPDPRATDESWMVTTPVLVHLGEVDGLPEVAGADDADRAEWVPTDSYEHLLASLAAIGGAVFPAHVDMLRDLLG